MLTFYPDDWTERSKSDAFKQRESPIWCKQLLYGQTTTMGARPPGVSWAHVLASGWKEDKFISFSFLSQSSWCFPQNCIPVKVEASQRQPFDYNGKLSHTLRVGKTQMTHPTYSLVGNSGIDFTFQQRNIGDFCNKKQIKNFHCMFCSLLVDFDSYVYYIISRHAVNGQYSIFTEVMYHL